MDQSLAEATAIVTGAAQGIGRTIAEKLGEEGSTVVVADVNTEAGESTVHDLTEMGVNAAFVECDVTDRSQVRHLRDDTVDRFGTVDILVNNAGISDTTPFLEITDEEWDQMIEINLTGVYNVSRAVAPEMIAKGGGRIVNISSMAGRNISFLADASYTASKWGVIGLTKHMAWDLGPDGITVNAVCPGPTMTDMVRSNVDPDVLERTVGRIPVGRLADPEDQANAVLFLISDRGSYFNGAVLDVDGGLYLSTRGDI